MFGKLISLLGLVALCSAGQFSISVEKSGSLREQLIREGRYGQELARIQQLSTGNVSFFDHFDEYYTAGVRIGTPGEFSDVRGASKRKQKISAQHFQVAFDTTSSNLWVFGVECRSQNCHGGRGRRWVCWPQSNSWDFWKSFRDREYNRTASSTFVAGTSSFNLPYDGGHVSGNVGKDTAQFAGFTIQSQDFGIGTAATRLFGETFDGVLGLGWPATALNGTSTTMQNLLPQLDQKLFTTYFTKSNMHNGTAGGDIMFGAIDTTHCQSQVNYVPLAYNSFWSYSVDGFSIGTYSRTQTETVLFLLGVFLAKLESNKTPNWKRNTLG